jgi:acetylornithine deacetylase/succinyl-diaminopimelate desuccinylase-like protein
VLGFGPGDERLAHRADEHVELAQLEGAARGYEALAVALTAPRGDGAAGRTAP